MVMSGQITQVARMVKDLTRARAFWRGALELPEVPAFAQVPDRSNRHEDGRDLVLHAVRAG